MDVEALLEELSWSPDLGAFRELVGPLLAYDRERRSDLVQTLRVYFAAGANAIEAADPPFLHRHSVLYCRARIEKLTGLDLKDPRARLALQLGLLTIGDGGRNPNNEVEYP